MTDLVTKTQLLTLAPHALNPQVTAQALSENMLRCEITSPRRIRHFMAHLAVECAYFSRLDENLNYSVAGLCQTWPSRFPNPAIAKKVARNPRAIAQAVYGDRMGNEGPLDGWLYRGSGFIMLTGKTNYRRASSWTGLDLVTHPELARQTISAAKIACDFWRVHGLNAIVDTDADESVVTCLADEIRLNEEDDLEEGTRVINGGLNGLSIRRKALLAAAAIWI